jgi:hypothetical protein
VSKEWGEAEGEGGGEEGRGERSGRGRGWRARCGARGRNTLDTERTHPTPGFNHVHSQHRQRRMVEAKRRRSGTGSCSVHNVITLLYNKCYYFTKKIMSDIKRTAHAKSASMSTAPTFTMPTEPKQQRCSGARVLHCSY